MTQWYYRFYEQSYCSADEFGDPGPTYTRVKVARMKVIRTTPKGAWLVGMKYGYSNPRFVCNEHTKRYAYPTIEEARTSYLARKRRQASIYRARYDRAVMCAQKAERNDYELHGEW